MNNSIKAPLGFVITLALIFILSGVLAVARVNDYLAARDDRGDNATFQLTFRDFPMLQGLRGTG